MTAPTVHATRTRHSSERNPAVATALRTVLSLTSTLAARWEDLDPEVRRQTLDELIDAVGGLSRIVEGQAAEAEALEWDPQFNGLGLLTPRESQVLRALAAGGSTTGIARALGISPATVRSHVKSILAKLGVHSRVEAIAVAARSNEAPRTRQSRS